ncbi:MAG: molybdate ABC transporter substrate-binding protein [Proteobacteria bacterium]|nr:molybdate ABC transporter substrate-binding protein [Pseudomonadota bacterium]
MIQARLLSVLLCWMSPIVFEYQDTHHFKGEYQDTHHFKGEYQDTHHFTIITHHPAHVAANGLNAAYSDNEGPIHIAVASNFNAPMKAITTAFQASTGYQIRTSFGSSGKLLAQTMSGAPFMVFFSADQDKPAALEKSGLIVPGTRFTYAVGGLTLWSANPTLIDAQASVLKEGRFNKLALANPRVAPYGTAALEVLQFLGLEERTRSKWVQGENIAQTFQFVSTGNADIGFVALSQIIVDGNIRQGSFWQVPPGSHRPINQDVVLLRRGATNLAARALLEFVQSEEAISIIESHGYGHPSAGKSGNPLKPTPYIQAAATP